MSKFFKVFAIAALVAGALAMTPGPAAAQRHGHGGHGGWHGGHGGWHGGGWRGGHGGWHGGGWHGRRWYGGGWGWGPAWGWGYPYYYGGYYGDQACGWARVRVWRHGHWVLRRAWRCW